MQASTRIGIALCVLVTGGALAGLFRRFPGPLVSPADRAEPQLALRQPDEAPVMAAGAASAARRNTPALTAGPSKPATPSAGRDGRPLAGVKTSEPAASSPLPRMPELASGDFAGAGSAWGSEPARQLAIPLAPGLHASPRTTTAAADDDWQLHEVTDGDTLAKLAQHYYGDPALAEAIQRANTALVKNANILPIGAFLKIPSRGAAAPVTTGRTSPNETWRQAPAARP